MQTCPLCGRPCPEGHFHAVDHPASPHLCGRMHHCVDPTTDQPRLCACAGVCTITSQLQSTKTEAATLKTFQGKRDQFEYEVKTCQVAKRNVCTKLIPPEELQHEGPCCCTQKPEEHWCGHECPGCKYMCRKHHNHDGRHKMEHGNLDQDSFLSNREEFDLGDRKYALLKRNHLQCITDGARSHAQSAVKLWLMRDVTGCMLSWILNCFDSEHKQVIADCALMLL
jgi:hypothetical protein